MNSPYDLSELTPVLGPDDMLIDEKNGVFASRLATKAEGFKVILAPGMEIRHINVFANGTRVVTIAKAK